MKLSHLIAGARVVRQDADPATEISGLTDDSRAVKPGWLFAAVPGFKLDGHGFVPAAAAAGAAAVMTERWLEDAGVPQVQVPVVRRAMALAAANFHGHPSEKMTMVGVTGTNGKTTTSYFIDAILKAAGRETGLVGGIEYRFAGHATPATRTTPEAPALQELLARMSAGGVDAVTLEVSSHGIELYRVAFTRFDVAVFTNLTREHLDLHRDMEAYFAAKKRLFTAGLEEMGEPSPYGKPLAVINIDDDYGRRLAAELDPGRLVTFSLSGAALVRPGNIRREGWQTTFDLVTPAGRTPVRLHLPGTFNIANALAAAACGHALGIEDPVIADALDAVETIPGRFEPVDIDAPFSVVVDYAHNVDGLVKSLQAAREIAPGRLIVVFGCPGERDRDKRPEMGKAAGSYADLVLLTTDDCYSEPPERILDETEPGLVASGGRYLRISDRRQAIETALGEAGAGDLVLIAGKGHETEQIMPEGSMPFSDTAVVREALAGG